MKRKKLKKEVILLIILIPLFICLMNNYIFDNDTDLYYDNNQQWQYINKNKNEYPKSLIELAKRNKETISFVYNYKNKRNMEIDIRDEIHNDEIPLFLQWDKRWGYELYGDDFMAINGCGPTCLSMVASYLKQDSKLNPYYIAKYSFKRGYLTEVGTSWNLMSLGARDLGLKAEELPLDENMIKNCLLEGKPIICSMSKGIFTDSGHFIVLKEYKDGKIYVNDPNSLEKSKIGYTFKQIRYQIKNLWVYDY